MESTASEFEFFWTGPFSQWYRSEFVLDGLTFATAEQAMMYYKALLFEDHAIANSILASDDPGQQKALGRQVRGFLEDVWVKNRVRIVYRINVAKFEQNKGLRRKLFQTLGKTLVEASAVDLIWGIGLSAEVAHQTPRDQWPGRNLLGQVITDVRDALAARYPEEAALVAKHESPA